MSAAQVQEFDLIVIGGGSGGSATARRAAGYGARVLLVERGTTRDASGKRIGAGVGGTCVNVGCVPKKLMFQAASQREAMFGEHSLARSFELEVAEGTGRFDWSAMKAKRDAYVSRLNGIYMKNWTKAGIEVAIGTGEFVNSNTVRVTPSDGAGPAQLYSARHIVIAVGGEPNTLAVPGGELAINSDGFFDLDQQPKKVALIGAGYIGVELAGIMHALGSDAHLFFRAENILRGFDSFIVETLTMQMQAHGPTLHPKFTPKKLEKADDGTITLTGADGQVFEGFDCVLSAIGRSVVTDILRLDRANVQTTQRGHVIVDEFENTNVPGIYALGDVTNTGYELTPVAIAAGRRLADRLFGHEAAARIEYGNIATVVFSHPPIGTIGLTEEQAVQKFGQENIRVKKARFPSMLYAFSDESAKVKTGMKLILAGPEERVVGLHCIGPYSDEMMQGFAVAVRMGATRRDFEAAVAIHPTIAEEMVTFGGWGMSAPSPDGTTVPLLPPYLDAKDAGAKQKQPALSSTTSARKSDPPQECLSSSWSTFAQGLLFGALVGAGAVVVLAKPRL